MFLSRILRQAFSASGAVQPPVEQEERGNPLERWYFNHSGRLITKWPHYFDIYHRHFARYRGECPVVLEIGVQHGGSIEMWHDYFGAGCKYFGVDINPQCKMFEDEGTTILIGDQADRSFLARLRDEVPRVDILIDDGGHMMQQQIATFEALYPHVAGDGVYLCEDMHTSYWKAFGGGYRKPTSFVEYTKDYIDQMNAWYSQQRDVLDANDFTRSTHAMHYYNSILVIEKRPTDLPKNTSRGRPSF